MVCSISCLAWQGRRRTPRAVARRGSHATHRSYGVTCPMVRLGDVWPSFCGRSSWYGWSGVERRQLDHPGKFCHSSGIDARVPVSGLKAGIGWKSVRKAVPVDVVNAKPHRICLSAMFPNLSEHRIRYPVAGKHAVCSLSESRRRGWGSAGEVCDRTNCRETEPGPTKTVSLSASQINSRSDWVLRTGRALGPQTRCLPLDGTGEARSFIGGFLPSFTVLRPARR